RQAGNLSLSRTDVPSGFLEAAGHLSGGTGSGAGNRDAYATRHRLPSLASAGLFFPPLPSRRPVPLHPPQLSVRRRVPVRRKTDRRLLDPKPPKQLGKGGTDRRLQPLAVRSPPLLKGDGDPIRPFLHHLIVTDLIPRLPHRTPDEIGEDRAVSPAAFILQIKHIVAAPLHPFDGGHRRAAGTRLVGQHQDVIQPEADDGLRSEEHTSELQSRENLVCRLLLEKKKSARIPSDWSSP